MIANCYLLQNMSELQDPVRDSKMFRNNDLKNSNHLIQIEEANEWKTAF
jgi:hypothetical protein